MIFLVHEESGGRMVAQDINGDGGEAQARIYEARDWVRVDGVVLAAASHVGRPIAKLDELSKDELIEFALAKNLDVDATKNKAALVKTITAQFGTDEEAALQSDITAPPTEPEPEPQEQES